MPVPPIDVLSGLGPDGTGNFVGAGLPRPFQKRFRERNPALLSGVQELALAFFASAS